MKLYKIFSSIINGFSVTLGMFFKTPVTIDYPNNQETPTSATKFEHALMPDDSGKLKCIACRMCEQACPAGAISIKAQEDDKGKSILESFDIDYSKCIYCNLCVQSCPVGSIKDVPCLDSAAKPDKSSFVYNKDKLAENGRKYKVFIEGSK
ncbi:MAG: NADH-quinone oxidoreductase subunit I [Proteobacteria bacterium]|nr:NADH-quinone oxidoreductase subunit I [Pseudomonadota bacterium]